MSPPTNHARQQLGSQPDLPERIAVAETRITQHDEVLDKVAGKLDVVLTKLERMHGAAWLLAILWSVVVATGLFRTLHWSALLTGAQSQQQASQESK